MAYICNNNKPVVTESQKPSCIRLKKHRPPHLEGCPCKTFSTKEQVKMDSAAESLYPPSIPTIPDKPGKKKRKSWPTASSTSSSKFLHFLIPNLFSKKALLPKEDVRPECSANRRNTNTEEERFLPMGTLWSLTPRESAECFIGNKLCLGYEGEQQRKCCWAGSGICWALINAKASYIHHASFHFIHKILKNKH